MVSDSNRRSITSIGLIVAGICLLSMLVGVIGRDRTNDVSTAELARDPDRLKAALRACRMRITPADDPSCRAVSEAWRRHFFGRDQAHRPVLNAAAHAQPSPTQGASSFATAPRRSAP